MGVRNGAVERDAEFADFVRQAQDPLWRTAWLLTGDRRTSTRLVEAALVETYRSWPRLSDGGALLHARRRVLAHSVDVWGPGGSTDGEPDHHTARWLAALPEKERQVLVLRSWCGLSPGRAAETLGLPTTSVASLEARGLTAAPARDGDVLRQRLDELVPTDPVALDPHAVPELAARVSRRRRHRLAAAALLVVVVVASAAAALVGRRPPEASPSPRPAPTPTAVHVDLGANGGPDRAWDVTIGSPDGTGTRTVTWREGGADGSVTRDRVHDGDRRAAWSASDRGRLVLGELPDDRAGQQLLDDSTQGGTAASTVVSLPGTGWSVFAIAYEKAPAQGAPFTQLVWFDGEGRPVDRDGATGAVAAVPRGRVWITADGSVLGRELDGGLYSTPMSAQGKAVLGDYPRILMGAPDAAAWELTIRLKPEATSAVAVLADGRRIPLTVTRLGRWNVGLSEGVASATAPAPARVWWTDADRAQHDDVVRPVPTG